jgi:hypothetical protein
MHDKATTPRSTTCVIKNLNDQAVVVLASILGPTAPIPTTVFVGDVARSTPVTIVSTSLNASRSIPPDPPPPRA